jgi:geranylgeranyl pyrophosphate synthase
MLRQHMTQEDKLMQRVINLFRERGLAAVEASKQYAMKDKITYQPLENALQFFFQEIWFDFLHPTLIALACEAVGGETEKTLNIGAAVVLLAGGADIHDDIIDESVAKGSIPTVFGKFGRDVAVLAGDVLLQKGLYMLHESCAGLPKDQKQEILELVKNAFLEICGGEAREASLRGRTDISRQEYLNVIRQKVAASEATTRIGAILGGGSRKEIDQLGHFGRTYGILMTIRDEFIDVFEADELKNRFGKECLPMPVLLSLQDESRKGSVLQLLDGELSEDAIEKILDLVMPSKGTVQLLADMNHWVRKEIALLSPLNRCKDIFNLLLQATLEDLSQ